MLSRKNNAGHSAFAETLHSFLLSKNMCWYLVNIICAAVKNVSSAQFSSVYRIPESLFSNTAEYFSSSKKYFSFQCCIFSMASSFVSGSE